MADSVNLDPAKTKEIEEQALNLSTLFDNLIGSAEDFSQKFKEIGGEAAAYFTTTTEETKKVLKALSDGSLSAEQFANSSSVLNGGLALLSRNLISVTTDFTYFNKQAGIGIESMTTLNSKMTTVSETLKKVFGSVGGKIGQELVGQTLGIYEDLNYVRNLESNLFRVMGTSGGLGIETEVGIASAAELVDKLDSETRRLTESSGLLAFSTGITAAEFDKYRAQIMQLPGAYRLASEGSSKFGSVNELTTQALKIANGTTGDFASVMETLEFQYQQFGTTNESVLETFAKTYEMSNKLGIRFNDLWAPIKNITTLFADFGDNTDAASDVAGTLFGRLKEAGLGITPATSAITQMTSAIHNLDIGSASFISSSTGGPGGLRGAFEIQELLAQGKMTEVLDKVRESFMRQMGGQMVTRAEAAQSDVAASQYAKQLAFLQSGPYGQLVQGMGGADAVMKALAGGAITPTGAGEAAYGRAEGVGESMIARRQDVVLESTIAAEQQTRLGRLATGQTMGRGLFSVATGESEASLQLRQRAIGAEREGLRVGLDTGKSIEEALAEQSIRLKDAGVDMIMSFGNALHEAISRVGAEQKAKQELEAATRVEAAMVAPATARGGQLVEPAGAAQPTGPIPVFVQGGKMTVQVNLTKDGQLIDSTESSAIVAGLGGNP